MRYIGRISDLLLIIIPDQLYFLVGKEVGVACELKCDFFPGLGRFSGKHLIKHVFPENFIDYGVIIQLFAQLIHHLETIAVICKFNFVNPFGQFGKIQCFKNELELRQRFADAAEVGVCVRLRPL